MELNSLNAISPIDGRYFKVCEPLANYFSEEALIKYRIKVEVEYFIALCELPLPQLKNVSRDSYDGLRKLYEQFTSDDALRIKTIEHTTNHDVKAVEYFLKEEFDKLNLSEYKEMKLTKDDEFTFPILPELTKSPKSPTNLFYGKPNLSFYSKGSNKHVSQQISEIGRAHV